MAYGVRQYGTREYGDGARVITDASPYGGGGGGGDDIAGTDTLTFGGTATLTAGATMMSSSGSAVILGGSGTLVGNVLATTETSVDRLTFGGYATLTAEVAVVPPPATAPFIKKVVVTMPAPTAFRKGRPTA
jgi:hypothetical protein